MQKPTHAALLVGSPKGQNSTSNSLGSYLIEKLEQKGLSSEKVYVNQCLGSEEKQAVILRLVDSSDLIILAFPLYVDSLHSQVINTLELIAEHEKSKLNLNKKKFVAIANSGFPEAKHNEIALTVCRIFAKQVGYSWAGGLAMGGGGMISGRPLNELGGMVRNQKKALDIVADALSQGEAIPQKAVALISKIGIPKWLYLWMGNRGWKQESKQQIATEELYNKPFKTER